MNVFDDDLEVDTNVLVRKELNEAEGYLNAKRLDEAELALNRAAAKFRHLELPNTSNRYLKLSRGAVMLRVDGEWNHTDDSDTE